MHFLIALVGLIAAAGAWYWRLQMAAKAGRGALDAAKTVANLPRRLGFLRKTGKRGLDLVEDPRDAAAVLMVVVATGSAEEDRPLDEAARGRIAQTLIQRFGMTEADAAETIVNAKWLLGAGADPFRAVDKMTRLITRAPSIDDQDREDLGAMLAEVAAASDGTGATSDTQRALLDRYEALIRRAG